MEQNLSVYSEKKLEKVCDPEPTVLASPLAGGARETLRARDNQQSFLQLRSLQVLLNSSCCPSPTVPEVVQLICVSVKI